MKLTRIVARLVQSTVNSKEFKDVVEGRKANLQIEVPEELCQELLPIFKGTYGTEKHQTQQSKSYSFY